MSNRDPDLTYRSYTDAVRFALAQWRKQVWAALPAVVIAYNSAQRTCVAQPVPAMRLTDGSTVDRPPVRGVPVLWPAAGGVVLRGTLAAGDGVLLVVASRDISGFKQSRRGGRAPSPRVHDMADAVAVPGFGPVGAVSPVGDWALQTDDGDMAISMSADSGGGVSEIRLAADRIRFDYVGGSASWYRPPPS